MGVLLVGMAKRTIPEKPGFRESCTKIDCGYLRIR